MDHVLTRGALALLVAACSIPDAPSPPEACHELAHATGDMFVRCGLGSHADGLRIVIGDRATGTLGPEDGCNRAVSYDPDLLESCLADLAETCALDHAETCSRAVRFDDEMLAQPLRTGTPAPGHGDTCTCGRPRDVPCARPPFAPRAPARRLHTPAIRSDKQGGGGHMRRFTIIFAITLALAAPRSALAAPWRVVVVPLGVDETCLDPASLAERILAGAACRIATRTTPPRVSSWSASAAPSTALTVHVRAPHIDKTVSLDPPPCHETQAAVARVATLMVRAAVRGLRADDAEGPASAADVAEAQASIAGGSCSRSPWARASWTPSCSTRRTRSQHPPSEPSWES